MNTVTGKVWSFADVNASRPVGKQYDSFGDWLLMNPLRGEGSRDGGEVIVQRETAGDVWVAVPADVQEEFIASGESVWRKVLRKFRSGSSV